MANSRGAASSNVRWLRILARLFAVRTRSMRSGRYAMLPARLFGERGLVADVDGLGVALGLP